MLAHLALHRCTGADGKVTYTEFHCEQGATASGVDIRDSSGMNINKRTTNFSYTPLVKMVPKADAEREQRALDRQWEDYKKQQSELRNEYGNQPARR